MPEMIERVARAICNSAEADDYDALTDNGVVKGMYRQQARAAIEAMRPTTKAMRLAMCPMNGADYVVGDPGDVWSAAIDAALTE